jgi:3-oxoacyl-[acyl-carrier-protein] synthase II
MDPYLHYAMAAVEEGVKDAGIEGSQIDRDHVGVIWASGIGGLKTFEEEVSYFAQGDGTPRFNPFFIPKMISDIAAGMISIRYGFRGPNYATVSACASSTHALIAACDAIRLGRAVMIVAGGSEAAVTASGVGGFNAMKALSERNDDPTTASRPFDLDRDGFVLGEGAGCLIVEEYEHAVARGAHIYCELAGGGMSADAYHMTAPHPDGLGATLVMHDALRDAGMTIEDIDYVNVHGTSTPLGDPQEIKAIEAVFGEQAYKMNISSTKSMTGHLLGAAGAIEAIASIKAMEHSLIPPTINHFTDDPAFNTKLNLTFNKAQSKNLDAVLSNTFGFGGHNASVIFRKIS